MSQFPNRAALWLNKLAPDAPLMSGLCPSVQVADGQINGENVRFIAVVPDANNHYPRAAGGEVGLLEGWTLAKVVNETIAADADRPVKRPIVAVIDVPSQAYGRREEAFGIHQALAGAAGGRFPGLGIRMEKLADYDYMMQNFYSIHPTTTAGRELMDAEHFLAMDLSLDQGNGRDGSTAQTAPKEPQILIYHTHSQETFSDYPENPEASITGVGAYLSELLEGIFCDP